MSISHGVFRLVRFAHPIRYAFANGSPLEQHDRLPRSTALKVCACADVGSELQKFSSKFLYNVLLTEQRRKIFLRDYIPVSAASNAAYNAFAPGLTGPFGSGRQGQNVGGSLSA